MDFTGHALGTHFSKTVRELLMTEYARLRTSLKPCEQERKRTVLEELILRLARVLVHRISDDREVDQRVL